jgi:ribosomal protein L16 Arg81 hydroxylase
MVAFDAQRLSRSLIGGMQIQAFNRDIREKKTARFQAAIDLEHLDHLCSLSNLETLFKWEAIPVTHVDIFDGDQLKKLVDVPRGHAQSHLAVVTDHLRRGATVRVRDLDQFDARLNRFVAEVRRLFAAQAQINAYLTPSARAGFPPHFDITDVFIVQCVGSKQWEIFPDYSNKKELPLMATRWDPDRFRPSAPPETMTLQPGDVLYLPRGAMHQAFCTDRESVHLTISLVPLTLGDFLGKALAEAADNHVELRRRLPWPDENEETDHEALIALVKARMNELLEQIDVDALLRQERRLFQNEPVAGPTNGLASALASVREQTGSLTTARRPAEA